ncbi:GNAT family N-acetyltransferase|uniref:GNAT family N-acetyltransferase n=1 Tax=Noviherbaspirillum sp. L7-7A TaxID=2850560 RepID=UPI001C2C828E|nr:GNAT family N-acetyltransferase [Noviherbaspirillum sp. L7-7A]MBV0879713.1 GNAT family N-acetyltransferase [Noviherbaspirillum sp. L7-7A]
MSVMDIRFTMQDDCVAFSDVARCYASTGFGCVADNLQDSGLAAAFLAPGSYRYFALDGDNNLVGLARVLTDGGMCSWIAELCVAPSWRKRGIGSRLMALVLEKSGHTDIYADALTGEERFFAKHGVKPRASLVACSRALR